MNAVKRRSIFELVALILCAVSFITPAPAQQVDASSYQRVVDENIDLRQEQARLSGEIGELRRKNADLILDVRDLEAKREQLATLVAQLKTPEESRVDLDRLRAERAALMGELERVRRSLLTVVASPTNPPPAPPVLPPVQPSPAQGSSLFRKIEQENVDLRQSLTQERDVLATRTKALEAATAQVAEFRSQMEKLVKDAGVVKQELEQSRQKELALKKALEKLARQAFQQQQELAGLKAELAKRDEGKAREEFQSGAGTAATSGQDKEAGVSPQGGVMDAGALLLAAQKALKAGRVHEAEKMYGEIMKKTPKDPRVYYNLGVLHSDYLNNPGKAVQFFRKYLELSPKARDAAQVRAWIRDLEMASRR